MIPEDNKKEQERKMDAMNYPANEDIYNQEPHIPMDANGVPLDGKNSTEDMDMGLDIPGSELDDAQQSVGTEDEENNYWSLGGENHDDLETDIS